MQQLLKDPFQLLIPLAILAATVVAGLVIRRILFGVLRGWAARTESKLDFLLMQSLQGPIILWSLILGLHLATQNSEIPRVYLRYLPRTLAVLWILSLTMAMSRLAGDAVHFYGSRMVGARSVTSLTQKLAQLAVVFIGLGVLLRAFDVSLTPILTTLGVGGLAVALALQDTLSNLFAGFYVSISGLVRLGDYIKLNTGEEGYVTDINWRCTTMLGNTNNVVVVPNNKLGQAIYTNYNLPDHRMAVSMPISVAGEADLDRVQQLLLQEIVSAAGTVKGLVVEPAPYVLFKPDSPRDAALTFQLNFSINEFASQDFVQSELRKRIYKRLKAEGITTPFPPRTILYEQKNPA